MKFTQGVRRIAGFTTLEMVSAVTIGAMTILLIMSVYIASLRYFSREYPSWTCNRSTEMATEYMTRDIRSAAQPIASYGPVSTSDNSIVLKVPSYDNNGIIDDAFDYIAYYVDRDHDLKRTVVSGGGKRAGEIGRTLASGISDLTLVYSCQDQFTGDGSGRAFTTSYQWADTPTVMVDARTVSGYSLDWGNHRVTFTQAPSSSSTVTLQYPVVPTNVGALGKVLMVSFEVSGHQEAGSSSASSVLSADVRLRNSR